MNAKELIDELNTFATWAHVQDQDKQPMTRVTCLISMLCEVFAHAQQEERRMIHSTLAATAMPLIGHFTIGRATEARATLSRHPLFAGLVAVIMAGGRSASRSGTALMAIIVHSSERIGLDTRTIFKEAAEVALDEEQANWIRTFPCLPEHDRDIRRWGYRERQTHKGVQYEHCAERGFRRSWWDRLLGRSNAAQEKFRRDLQALDDYYRSENR